MNMPWTSYFKNGVPAQTLASLDQEESRRHTQPALGGARGVAVTSMTGTGRMASPPLAEGGKHAAALQEWTLPLGHPGSSRAGPLAWLCAAAGLRDPRHLIRTASAAHLYDTPLRRL